MLATLTHDRSVFPSAIANDASIGSLSDTIEWLNAHLTTLKDELAATGALLFRGFPVDNVHSYDRFFSSFNFNAFTYDESLSNAVRVNHTPRVFTANEAPADVEIFLHNEMAQTPIYPRVISLFCESAAEEGGATALCRCDQLYERLSAEEAALTAKLENTGIKYTTAMPYKDSPETGQGRNWQGTLNVETRDEAEQKLRALGYSWRWNQGQVLLAQTAALPAVRLLDDGRRVFFNQIIAAYMGWKGVRENPSSALCFGDDSPIPHGFLEKVVSISEELVYDLCWQDGDVALVDNNLVMHGRRPYAGDRKRMVFVALGR